jgi:VanZ family protein
MLMASGWSVIADRLYLTGKAKSGTKKVPCTFGSWLGPGWVIPFLYTELKMYHAP